MGRIKTVTERAQKKICLDHVLECEQSFLFQIKNDKKIDAKSYPERLYEMQKNLKYTQAPAHMCLLTTHNLTDRPLPNFCL